MLAWEPRERRGKPGLTELAAAKFVETHGCDALRILDERAETAAELGHKLAARTWRDMADAAARLLRTERVGAGIDVLSNPFIAHRAGWLR